MYVIESKTTYEIAKKLGMQQSNLYNIMKKLLIPLRSRREARKLWWKQQKELEKIKEAKNGSN